MEATSTIYFGNRKTNLILSSRCAKHLEVKQCASQVFFPLPISYIAWVPSSSQEFHSSPTLVYIQQTTSWKACTKTDTIIKAGLQMTMYNPRVKKKKKKKRRHTEFSTLHVKKNELDFTYINLEVQSLYYNSTTYCLDNRSYLYIMSSNLEK